MYYILPILILMLLTILPHLWVKRVFLRNSQTDPDIPGTGGELAEYLVQKFNYRNVSVVETKEGDHFNPETNIIALNERTFHGKSLTAIVVTAHEIGHLIQHENREPLLETRSTLIKKVIKFRPYAGFAMMLFPIVVIVFKSPLILLLFVAIAFSATLLETAVHFITLPVELDASFKKALPILREGGYIKEEDEPEVKKILLAAALTYMVTALSGLLDLGRWIRVLRRR